MMNEYMLFTRGDETPPGSPHFNPDYEAWAAWGRELSEKGRFKEMLPVHMEAWIVGIDGVSRTKTGEDGATDVNGYAIIYAESIDEAAELSRGCPILQRGGVVEVRPLMPRGDHQHF